MIFSQTYGYLYDLNPKGCAHVARSWHQRNQGRNKLSRSDVLVVKLLQLVISWLIIWVVVRTVIKSYSFDIANSHFKIKSTVFLIGIEHINTSGGGVAHNRCISSKVLMSLAASYLPCFQRVHRKWTCSLMKRSISSQVFIRLFYHSNGSPNVKL